MENFDNMNLKATMNSWSRSIELGNAVFKAYNSENKDEWQYITVDEHGVLGQITNAPNEKSMKMGKEPQATERAFLSDATYENWFSGVTVPFSREARSCDNIDVFNAFKDITEAYKNLGGYKLLTSLYVYQIANGSFAWKNKYLTNEAEVTIKVYNKSITFDVFKLDAIVSDKHNSTETVISELTNAVKHAEDTSVEEVIELLASGLDGTERQVRFYVEYDAKVPAATEVFPSQEYLRSAKQAPSTADRISKVLGKMKHKNKNVGIFHSQKVGAAIRSIDIWNNEKTVPINAYAGDHQTFAVYRTEADDDGGANNFYYIIMNPAKTLSSLATAKSLDEVEGDVHFMIANLIRGGVYGIKE